MRTLPKNTLAASALLSLVVSASAAQLELVHAFQVGPVNPAAKLVQGKDGNLYGTTAGGPNAGPGTVFKISTNAALTTLFQFTTAVDDANGSPTNIDGANPQAGLVFGGDGNLYGTTSAGGANGYGTVFRVTPEGDLTTLVSFDSAHGANPQAELVLGADGSFYGTTSRGGSSDHGAVFKVTTNGVLTTLASFAGGANGGSPQAALVLGPTGDLYGTTAHGGPGYGTVFHVTSNGLLTTLALLDGTASPLALGGDGNFYGTTSVGGSSYHGTIFRITTNRVLTTLFEFGPTFPGWPVGYTNVDGAGPQGGLVLAQDGSLYGMTTLGGSSGNGTVFRVTTKGVLTTLAQLDGFYGQGYSPGDPESALIRGSDGNFYGTAGGGASGDGAVFRFTTNGVLTSFFSFRGNRPSGMALGRDGNFYGTTSGGGSSGSGTVFQLATNGALTTLFEFDPPVANDGGAHTNGSGAYPDRLLLGGDAAFYGTTSGGGASGNGTMFRVTTNGGLATLASFNATNVPPASELALGSDGNFYGTWADQNDINWTVFKLSTNGVPATVAKFNGYVWQGPPGPRLVLGPDGGLYGTTAWGGQFFYGSAFKLRTNGLLTTVAEFSGTNGANPSMGLALGRDGNFYGITRFYGIPQEGPSGAFYDPTVFKLTPGGTLTGLRSLGTNNIDGLANGLVLGADGNFYGYASWASEGKSWFFQVTTNGVVTDFGTTGFFPGYNSGLRLVLGSDGNLYGTTRSGGPGGGGTIFRMRLGVVFTGVTPQPGGGVLLTGNGFPFHNQSYRLWASADASLPLASWTLLTTGAFDSGGGFGFVDTGASTNTSRFYRVSVP